MRKGGKMRALQLILVGVLVLFLTSCSSQYKDKIVGKWKCATMPFVMALIRHAGKNIELFLDGQSQGQASGPGNAVPITTDLRALGCERRWVQLGHQAFIGVNAFLNGAL